YKHMIDLLFINMCSTPGVHPRTTWEIIRHESGFNELAININSEAITFESLGLKKPGTNEDARHASQKLLDQKVNFDAGLMQVNSINFKSFSLSAQSAFEPCANIRAGTAILKNFYQSAEKILGPGQNALKAALSAYNTGNHSAGFKNGYVAKFYGRRALFQENPYKAGIAAYFDERVMPKKNPYSASIIPPEPKEGEKVYDKTAN
ncbi:MAG: lytic transglycosylase domain-containing protein, partial [Proteobacteria bacterium]|nr:lytic transglycosylase domain-containing protein [Pseudomonadota bacterium]